MTQFVETGFHRSRRAPLAPAILIRLIAGLILAWPGFISTAIGGDYTVTDPGDNPANPTLRWAINKANTNTGADTIKFNLTAPYIIRPTSQLPSLTNAGTTIDGTTQVSYVSSPVVCLHGSSAGAGVDGLRLDAATCTVKAIAVCGFALDGITVRYVGYSTIQGCFIMSNGYDGVDLYQSSGSLVGGTNALQRNVISSNAQAGVHIEDQSVSPTSCANNIVIGNFIGTTASGMAAQPNSIGVQISHSRFNTIGGSQQGARNIISGNTGRGIFIEGTNGWGNIVQNNYIGAASNGTTRLGNGTYGVNIEDSWSNTVGGVVAEQRNIISGNGADGVRINNSKAHDNVIQGNYIGLDSTGSALMSNDWDGVKIQLAPNTRIGGAVSGAGNVISGNDYGIYLDGTGVVNTVIQGNYIGLNAAGNGARGNQYGGIYIADGARSWIGGTNTAARNVISGNMGAGISIDNPNGSGGHVIEGNYIGVDATGMTSVSNMGMGIGLNSSNTRIGGTNILQRNIIAGNTGNGISISSTNAVDCGIFGNYVGVDATGTNAMPNDNGVVVNNGAKRIKIGGETPKSGNVISGNLQYGFYTYYGCSEITVQNNLIGTDVGGILPRGNGWTGVYIQDIGLGSHIGVAGGGNVIAANQQYGMRIYDATNLGIRANLVGVGTNFVDLGNQNDGIRMYRSAGVAVGGVGATERNTIAGNGGDGISLSICIGCSVTYNYIGMNAFGLIISNDQTGIELTTCNSNRFENNTISGNGQDGVDAYDCSGNTFLANAIGTDPTGVNPAGNRFDGIHIGGNSVSNVIGNDRVSGNIISGNGRLGIWFDWSDVRYTRVAGNSIGVNLAGSSPIPNGADGVNLYGSSFNRIGGTNTTQFNVISGNGDSGIVINGDPSHDNWVQGNIIGMDSSLTRAIPNGECGVRINGNASTNIIGGSAGFGNLIAYNREQGILMVQDSVANSILGNSIFGNRLLGIDLGNIGVTPNDDQDPDLGANRLQNYPVLLAASNNGTSIRVTGYLNSLPSTSFTIEFFGNDEPDLSGYGEGKTYITQLVYSTDSSGQIGFTNIIISPVPPPSFMTATATALGPNDTSEFSYRVMLDADGDGMPDGYEYTYSGGAGITNLNPFGHLDADGVNNLDEFIGNTDPTVTTSVTAIVSIRGESGDRVVTCSASDNRNYGVDTCSDLSAIPPLWWDYPVPIYRGTNNVCIYDGTVANFRAWRFKAYVP